MITEKAKIKRGLTYGLIVVIGTILLLLSKGGWFDGTHNSSMAYTLNDKDLGVVLTVSQAPIKSTGTNTISLVPCFVTGYKVASPENNQLLLQIIELKCDTCSDVSRTELLNLLRKRSVEYFGIDESNGVDYKAGEVSGKLYKTVKNDEPMQLFVCISGTNVYVYSETLKNVSEKLTDRYLQSLKIAEK